MQKTDIERRLDQLTGNLMGLQTLLLSVIATSGRRAAIAAHMRQEAEAQLAHLNAESGLPDDVLAYLEHWFATTLAFLDSDEAL